MPVWIALRCSIAIPFLIPPFTVDGMVYSDGATACNLPNNAFPSSVRRSDICSVFIWKCNKKASRMKRILNGISNNAQTQFIRNDSLLSINMMPCIVFRSCVTLSLKKLVIEKIKIGVICQIVYYLRLLQNKNDNRFTVSRAV